MEDRSVRSDKKNISTRGKIVMVFIALAGLVYWVIGKVEVWIGSIQAKQEQRKRNIDI